VIYDHFCAIKSRFRARKLYVRLVCESCLLYELDELTDIGVTNYERVTAYTFRHVGDAWYPHTHNSVFPLLNTTYIGVVTHDRTKREKVSPR
jgi:hypothetical protein